MLKLRYLILLGALLSLIVIVGCKAASTNDTTVCELHARLTSPPSGRVHLKAVVYRGPRHGAVLTDPRCPGKTIGLRLPDDIGQGTSLSAFNDALTGDVMDLSLRSFDVEISGTMKAAGPTMPEALFMIDQVDNFKKHPITSP